MEWVVIHTPLKVEAGKQPTKETLCSKREGGLVTWWHLRLTHSCLPAYNGSLDIGLHQNTLLQDRLRPGSLREPLKKHVPENKRLHLASRDGAQRGRLHVNDSAGVMRGEQTGSVLDNGEMNSLLVAATHR